LTTIQAVQRVWRDFALRQLSRAEAINDLTIPAFRWGHRARRSRSMNCPAAQPHVGRQHGERANRVDLLI
jgi:hypothetical protein